MSSLNLMPSVLSQKRAFIIPLPFNTCITHYSIHSLPLCRTLQCQLLEPCISTKSLHIEFKVLKLYGGRQYKFHGRCYVHYGNYSSRVSIWKLQCDANYFRVEAKGILSSERFDISFFESHQKNSVFVQKFQKQTNQLSVPTRLHHKRFTHSIRATQFLLKSRADVVARISVQLYRIRIALPIFVIF